MDENKIVDIVVCGDSFCTADNSTQRWHFSQFLQDRYGYNVVNLARGGMSNTGICFQIKEAITLNPRIVIYGTTTSARAEFVLNPKYKEENGLKNFVYPFPEELNWNNPRVGGLDAPIFSILAVLLDQQRGIEVSSEIIKAGEYWLKYMYQPGMTEEVDTWKFGYWHDQLLKQNILPIALTPTEMPGKLLWEYSFNNPVVMKVYHTDRKTQEQMAELLHQIIQQSS